VTQDPLQSTVWIAHKPTSMETSVSWDGDTPLKKIGKWLREGGESVAVTRGSFAIGRLDRDTSGTYTGTLT
jgi:16S rRNA U516 pseudouridylate synthase RsuA-like enzyme